MKVVILAGGFGTRISEESVLKPKPMVEIGDKPILWHIMKHYSQYGFNDFVICLGYKQYVVKEYFADYFLHTSDVTFDLAKNEMQVHNNYSEPWRVTLVDTGLHTMTGGRIKRIRDYIGDETFMLTYGDGVSNVDLDALVAFHKQHGKIATLTGGRAAEETQFGSITTGASNDIEQATKLARGMITRYGMSEEFDMVALETVTNQYLGGDASLACSAETQTRIDHQVVALVKKEHAKAVGILTENRAKLDELAKYLYEKETITGEEFMAILNRA